MKRVKNSRDATASERDGLAYCRKMLEEIELPDWRRCLVHIEPDKAMYYVMSGDDFRVATCVATFNMETLRRELSPENFRVFEVIFEQLLVQAQVASYAMRVAAENFGEVKRLRDQLPDAIAGRKRQADEARDEKVAMVALLEREAQRLRKLHPAMAIGEIRAKLSKIPGVPVRMVRAARVPRPIQKLPRP